MWIIRSVSKPGCVLLQINVQCTNVLWYTARNHNIVHCESISRVTWGFYSPWKYQLSGYSGDVDIELLEPDACSITRWCRWCETIAIDSARVASRNSRFYKSFTKDARNRESRARCRIMVLPFVAFIETQQMTFQNTLRRQKTLDFFNPEHVIRVIVNVIVKIWSLVDKWEIYFHL